MLMTNRNRDGKVYNNGFALIELLLVIAMLGILSAVAIPSFLGYIERAKQQVCHANTINIERMYYTHLFMENIEHTEVVFTQYLQEYGEDLCPDGGVISYVVGKVLCSVHPRGDNDEGDEVDDGSVPFL